MSGMNNKATQSSIIIQQKQQKSLKGSQYHKSAKQRKQTRLELQHKIRKKTNEQIHIIQQYYRKQMDGWTSQGVRQLCKKLTMTYQQVYKYLWQLKNRQKKKQNCKRPSQGSQSPSQPASFCSPPMPFEPSVKIQQDQPQIFRTPKQKTHKSKTSKYRTPNPKQKSSLSKSSLYKSSSSSSSSNPSSSSQQSQNSSHSSQSQYQSSSMVKQQQLQQQQNCRYTKFGNLQLQVPKYLKFAQEFYIVQSQKVPQQLKQLLQNQDRELQIQEEQAIKCQKSQSIQIGIQQNQLETTARKIRTAVKTRKTRRIRKTRKLLPQFDYGDFYIYTESSKKKRVKDDNTVFHRRFVHNLGQEIYQEEEEEESVQSWKQYYSE